MASARALAGRRPPAGQVAGEGEAVGEGAAARRGRPPGREGQEPLAEALAQLGGQYRPGPGDLAGALAAERGRGRPDPLRVEPPGHRAAADQGPDQGRLLGGQPRPVRRDLAAHRRTAPRDAAGLGRPATRGEQVAAAMASSSAASSGSGG